jgi:hypothetical protein
LRSYSPLNNTDHKTTNGSGMNLHCDEKLWEAKDKG